MTVRGATGNVSQVGYTDGRYSYVSDQDGAPASYICTNAVPSGQLLDVSSDLDVLIANGQSWAVDWIDPAGTGYDAALAERRTLMRFVDATGAFKGRQGTLNEVNTVVDMRGMDLASPSVNANRISQAALFTLQGLRRRAGATPAPVLSYCHGAGGKTWPQLSPGGEGYWENGFQFHAKAQELATAYGKTAKFRGVMWTQGSYSEPGDYYVSLGQMVAAYDALGLNTPGLRFYTDITGGRSTDTAGSPLMLAQKQFARDNSARVHLIGPRYPHPLFDTIHHTAKGYWRLGEVGGLAMRQTLDLGQPWEPLWDQSVTVAGDKVTIQTTQPVAGGALSVDTSYIEAAADYGFQVRVGGVPQAISNINLSDTTITLTLAAPIVAGTDVEVSYAWYGPSSTAGVHGGIWGNVKMAGPASVIFPGTTIDLWLCPIKTTVAAV